MGRVSFSNVTCPHTTRRAFTLIEVLVVVAVIALLVAILLPALSNARRQARTVLCSTNLRTSGQAVLYYAQANRDYYPAGGVWAEVSRPYVQVVSGGKKFQGREATTGGVDQTVEFYRCPDDAVRHRTWNVPQRVGGNLVRTNYRISYGMNGMLATLLRDNDLARQGKSYASIDELRKTTQVARAADVVMLTETGNDGIHYPEEVFWDFDEDEDPGIDGARLLEVHHRVGNNFIYADMHTRFEKVRGPKNEGVPAFPFHWIPIKGLQPPTKQ